MQVPSSATAGLHQEAADAPLGDSSGVIEWLMTETRDDRFIDNIFVEMCERLNRAGIPVSRGTLHFRILHPQWLGARILWQRGMKEGDIQTFGFAIEDSDRYRNRPVNEIHSGAQIVRQRLEPAFSVNAPPYTLYDELRAQGHTDYIAWPLKHTLGKQHIITFGSDRPGGFSDDDIAALSDLLPAFALVSEIRLKNRLARTLLETYVGPHASEQILAGATTRGSGVTVGAAILICDLRDFTGISDMWPRDDVIELLNGYFDAMAEPIERHGGEILKFMGDGLLAIFPLSNTNASRDLLAAIREAQTAMAALNEENVKKGHEPLGYGIGVHVGDVMYGNIGSRSRLDFTVIGPTVNVASRLESLTKEIKRPVLLSRAFVEIAGCEAKMENVGSHLLRGLSEPIDVFAF
ncbi:adenylate/guanylate cyclase domain-containing protein [Pararhizobium qamdonense]|uniref:adenylate/guanylate cyclase domain-containing protein n=1 Tax=Pararhizobium qamdonense TaxID=3031126 RepID=UPI0038B31545